MPLPPIVAEILRSGAPTLLTALAIPPPFNLIASAVVGGVLARFLPPGEAPAQPQPGGQPALSPDQVVRVVKDHAGDPQFLEQLREAEKRLQAYEASNNLKFAEIELRDREGARAFQASSGIAPTLLKWGMVIVGVAIVAMLGVVVASVLLMAGIVQVKDPQLAVGVFGLIGAVVGYISGYASQIIGFYFGSSQGSKEKTDALTLALQDQGQQIGRQVATAATTAEANVVRVEKLADQAIARSAPPVGLVVAAAVQWRQGPFGGVRWHVTPDGILVEGEASAARTEGEPVTVRRIWRDFGDIIRSVCQEHGVPAELVIATIAVESRGIVKASLVEPDGRTSVGLMQTLIGTASEVMKRPVTGAELETPAISIEAGTRYIHSQRRVTGFDPIKVAAAYNAGGLHEPRPQDTNPFRLRSTGDHLLRTKLYYNDVVATAKAEGWFR